MESGIKSILCKNISKSMHSFFYNMHFSIAFLKTACVTVLFIFLKLRVLDLFIHKQLQQNFISMYPHLFCSPFYLRKFQVAYCACPYCTNELNAISLISLVPIALLQAFSRKSQCKDYVCYLAVANFHEWNMKAKILII